MTLQSIGFKFFAKIMKGSCVFCCSNCISFNHTSHLKTNRNSKILVTLCPVMPPVKPNKKKKKIKLGFSFYPKFSGLT